MVTTCLVRTNGIIAAGTESHSGLACVFSYQTGDGSAPVQLRPPGRRLRCLGTIFMTRLHAVGPMVHQRQRPQFGGAVLRQGSWSVALKALDSISMEHTGRRNGIRNLHRLPQPEENTTAIAMEVTWQLSALNGPRLGPPWMILLLD